MYCIKLLINFSNATIFREVLIQLQAFPKNDVISALKENRFQIASQITPLQNAEDLNATAFENNTATAK